MGMACGKGRRRDVRRDGRCPADERQTTALMLQHGEAILRLPAAREDSH
jgi:hypothetical protein